MKNDKIKIMNSIYKDSTKNENLVKTPLIKKPILFEKNEVFAQNIIKTNTENKLTTYSLYKNLSNNASSIINKSKSISKQYPSYQQEPSYNNNSNSNFSARNMSKLQFLVGEKKSKPVITNSKLNYRKELYKISEKNIIQDGVLSMYNLY
jgi:hypothetical protein